MAKYLINDAEALALRKLVDTDKLSESLGFDSKRVRPVVNFPFRFKLLEAMGATIANKANANIYFFGDSTDNIYDIDNVVDDSSQYTNATSDVKGVCLASSVYHILELNSTSLQATEYLGLASTSYLVSDVTIVVDTLEPMNGIGTTLLTLSANNKFKWEIVNDGECYIKYNAHSSQYELLQTVCI